jgi:hypothetical protein
MRGGSMVSGDVFLVVEAVKCTQDFDAVPRKLAPENWPRVIIVPQKIGPE